MSPIKPDWIKLRRQFLRDAHDELGDDRWCELVIQLARDVMICNFSTDVPTLKDELIQASNAKQEAHNKATKAAEKRWGK